MKKIKVCTIGGGSSYTPELIDGFLQRYDAFPVSEIWLVDVEEGKEKLEIVANLARRMVKKSGHSIEIIHTLDRRKGLEGADFVTTQLRVGQLKARGFDEEICKNHGIIAQETNGPSGMLKACRTIPVILDICKDMEELCPEAWLINFTNPVGMVSEAVFRYTERKKYVGLCNVPIDMERKVAQFLQVVPDRVKIHFGGLNHMVFGYCVFLDGVDITKKFLSQLSEEKYSMTMNNITNIPWDKDLVKEAGVLLCPYHRYFLMGEEILQEQQVNPETRAELVSKVEEELFSLYQEESLEEKPEALSKRGGAYYSDAACNLIVSIYNDKRDIQVVNTLNRGAISNLPWDGVVEVSAVITKEGPIPLNLGPLPEEVVGLVQAIKSFEVTSAKAAVTGSYATALMGLTFHPFVQSQKKARAVLNDLLKAHERYLPAFHGWEENQ